MRQFTPHPGLIRAITSLNTSRFRVTELRDRYMALYPDSQNKLELKVVGLHWWILGMYFDVSNTSIYE